ncbi:MAG: M50 family metallopeptidase [Firmicutes bacterium]|nr:M50 family metallopeptidase [Bacillota bacterium]
MPLLIKFKRFEIHLSVFLLLLFALLFNFIYYISLVYAVVFLHELAHAFTAALLGVKIDRLEVLPFGITIHLKCAYIKKPLHEIIIAAAGPFGSALLAFVCVKFNFSSFLIISNAAVALINCIPALPLDGGRILRAILTESWGYVKAFNFTLKMTKLFSVFLLVLGAAIIYYTKFNFSLLIIGAFLAVNIIAERRGSRYVIMNEILKSKQKISNGCAERAAVIAISADEPARKALKLLSHNKYYLITVINSNMEIIGTVTETQLIEQLVFKGIRIKAKEMIDFG